MSMSQALKQIYIFEEPHCTGGNATIEITGEQIIDYMVKLNIEAYDELTFQKLIDDFCTNHWAWKKRV